MQRTDKISVCNVWPKCLASSTRGHGSEHWMENTYRVLLVAGTYTASLDQKWERKKTQVTWQNGKKSSGCLRLFAICSLSNSKKADEADSVSFSVCHFFLAISSFELLEKCNLGPPLESRAREGRAGSYHAWLEDIPNGKDNSLDFSPELWGTNQPTNQPAKTTPPGGAKSKTADSGELGVVGAGGRDQSKEGGEREGFLRTKTQREKRKSWY